MMEILLIGLFDRIFEVQRPFYTVYRRIYLAFFVKVFEKLSLGELRYFIQIKMDLL